MASALLPTAQIEGRQRVNPVEGTLDQRSVTSPSGRTVPVGRSLAFLILAHADPRQLANLLRALPADSHKLVHLDRKSREFDGFAPETPNTYVAERRLD